MPYVPYNNLRDWQEVFTRQIRFNVDYPFKKKIIKSYMFWPESPHNRKTKPLNLALFDGVVDPPNVRHMITCFKISEQGEIVLFPFLGVIDFDELIYEIISSGNVLFKQPYGVKGSIRIISDNLRILETVQQQYHPDNVNVELQVLPFYLNSYIMD